MAETKLNMQLLLRRDNVFTSTYVLEKGEPGFEVSTNILKIGNGTSTWAELPIANEASINTLISSAITAHAAGYYTKGEVDKFVSDINAAIATKLDASTFNTYTAAHENDYTNKAIDDAIAVVDGKFANYNTTAAQKVIDDEQDRIIGILEAKPFDTYATKTEVENVDKKFENYKTAEAQKAIDDEQDRRLGVIEGDYLKAADIADFETKANVKKVADDLAAYVESNDAEVLAVRGIADRKSVV